MSVSCSQTWEDRTRLSRRTSRRRRSSRNLPTPILAPLSYKGQSRREPRHIGRVLQQLGHPAQALAEFEQESPIWNELAKGGDPSLSGFTGKLRDEQEPLCYWLWADPARHGPRANGRSRSERTWSRRTRLTQTIGAAWRRACYGPAR